MDQIRNPVPGIHTSSLKRMMYENPEEELARVFKKGRFEPGKFNNGKIDEKFTNRLVQTQPSTEQVIRRHLYIRGTAPDLEREEGDDDNEILPSASPPVTTEDVCFLRKGDFSRVRDTAHSTMVKISKFDAMFGDPMIDYAETYMYDGGCLARVNYLIALQQLKLQKEGHKVERDQLLNEWHVGGAVRSEEGPAGEPSRAQSLGMNTVFGSPDYSTKFIGLTHQGPAKVYSVWGYNLPSGTDLWFIFKMVPLPKYYFLDPNTNPSNPRVKYTQSGRVFDDIEMLEAITDFSSVSGPRDVEAFKEQRRQQMQNTIDPSRVMVWQFVPYAKFKGGPSKKDLSYKLPIPVGNEVLDLLMEDGVAIKFGTVQHHTMAGYDNDVDPLKSAYDNNHVRNGKLIEVVVKMSRIYQ
jgi:hypothetical protein